MADWSLSVERTLHDGVDGGEPWSESLSVSGRHARQTTLTSAPRSPATRPACAPHAVMTRRGRSQEAGATLERRFMVLPLVLTGRTREWNRSAPLDR